jgi:hypothetical protein
MFAKRLQRRDREEIERMKGHVDVDVDDDHTRGGWSHREEISTASL